MNITLLLNSIFIMFIEYNKNDDITNIYNCKISNFNEPDNKVYSNLPYVDSFGLSFFSTAIPGYECGFANCSYNLYSIPNYYLAFQVGGILMAKTISVARVVPMPSLSPSYLPSYSPSLIPSNLTVGTSFKPTTLIVNNSAVASRSVSRTVLIILTCIYSFLFLLCIVFLVLLFDCHKICQKRNSEIVVNPNFLNQYF